MRRRTNSPEPRIIPGFFRLGFIAGFIFVLYSQKSQVSLLRYLTFSLVCGRIWQRGAPAGPPAVRVVGRWSPVATVQRRPRRQPRPSPSAPAKKPAKTLGFRRFSFFMCCMVLGFILVRTPGFRTWFYPFPTAATRSSTQNAPDFGCFRLKSGAFPCFCPLLTCNIFVSVFV